MLLPGCAPARATLIARPLVHAHAAAACLCPPAWPSIAGNARPLKNDGHPWAARHASGQPVFEVPAGYPQKRLACGIIRAGDGQHPVHAGTDGANALQMFADRGYLGGHAFRFRPRDQNQNHPQSGWFALAL